MNVVYATLSETDMKIEVSKNPQRPPLPAVFESLGFPGFLTLFLTEEVGMVVDNTGDKGHSVGRVGNWVPCKDSKVWKPRPDVTVTITVP